MAITSFRSLLLGLCLALFAGGGLQAEEVSDASGPGKVTGAKTITHPDWYKESFLEIAEDVSEAAESDKHVILFLEMNGCPYCYAMSEEAIVDPAGNATTPKAWAAELGLTYRPAIVLFDQGREIARIESMLYRYHFTGILEYVADGHYEEYPESPFRYIDAKTAELTAAGKDVSISEEN
jgi:thioredoxin-related protein